MLAEITSTGYTTYASDKIKFGDKQQLVSEHIEYKHEIYGITVTLSYASEYDNEMNRAYGNDLDDYYCEFPIARNFVKIYDYIRFEHPEYLASGGYTCQVFNPAKLIEGNAVHRVDYNIYKDCSDLDYIPVAEQKLMIKRGDIDVGDIIRFKRAGSKSRRVTTSEDVLIVRDNVQGYYNHYIVGGYKRKLFERDMRDVAVYSHIYKAWLWKGGD